MITESGQILQGDNEPAGVDSAGNDGSSRSEGKGAPSIGPAVLIAGLAAALLARRNGGNA